MDLDNKIFEWPTFFEIPNLWKFYILYYANFLFHF